MRPWEAIKVAAFAFFIVGTIVLCAVVLVAVIPDGWIIPASIALAFVAIVLALIEE